MLVCPQCQFENPNTNKFCQKCGTSLTHKTCYKCDSQVALSEQYCLNCGESVGTVWWAVITKEPDLQKEPESIASMEVGVAPTDEQLSTNSQEQLVVQGSSSVGEDTNDAPSFGNDISEQSSGNETTNVERSPNAAIENTEPSLVEAPSSTIEALSPASPNPHFVGAPSPPSSTESDKEADSRQDEQEFNSALGQTHSRGEWPFAPTVSPQPQSKEYLDAGQRYRLLEPLRQNENAESDGVGVRVLDTQPFQKSPLVALTAWNADCGMRNTQVDSVSGSGIGVPAIAQPYLALQKQFNQTLPRLHDAWQQNGTSTILLEDRSDWQLLRDLWGNNDLPMLQILEWLDEMAKLWSALEPWKCRQTLLVATNLRVDEDETMSLQQLYPEANDAPVLQDLGKMWQTLFQQSQKTQFGSLDQLFRELRIGEIATTEQLRSRLKAIVRELEEEGDMETGDLEHPLRARSSASDPLENVTSSSSGQETLSGEDVCDPLDDNEMPTVILPMQLLSLEDAGGTDIGRLREHNEDYFGIQTSSIKEENPMGRTVKARGLYILCDGMGGHAGGEIASMMAVETLSQYFQANWLLGEMPSEESIRSAVRLANKAIYDVNQQNSRSGSGRMGTTLVMLLIQETKIAVAHVGDSRLYRLSRKRGLEQVTVDHEVGQREIQRGVEPAIAYSRPDAYQLTQALGPRDENFVNPDVVFLDLNEDTLLLLCSDGLADRDLLETHWQTHLLPLISSRANLEQGVLQLIDLANQHNGHDNITAVLVRAKVRPNLDRQ